MKTIDTVEATALETSKIELAEKRKNLHQGIESKLIPKDGVYQNINSEVSGNLARWLGIEGELLMQQSRC